MVGGKIIEVRKEPGRYRLWCMDRHGDECAVYIEPFEHVNVGDSAWWQGGQVFLTPKGSLVSDLFAVKKIGFSFDPRPRP